LQPISDAYLVSRKGLNGSDVGKGGYLDISNFVVAVAHRAAQKGLGNEQFVIISGSSRKMRRKLLIELPLSR